MQTIRQSLLRSQVIIILLLGGAIMAATFVGARQAVEALSSSIIGRAMAGAELELRRFFDPVPAGLEVARSWGEAGLLDLDEPEQLKRLFLPLMEQIPQITSVMVADASGRELMLLRRGESWQMRVTAAPGTGVPARVWRWSESDPEPVQASEPIDYDPRQRPWYEGAKQRFDERDPRAPVVRNLVYWTEPYVFFTTQALGITAARAFDAAGGTAAGNGALRVVAFDVLLEDLTRFAESIEVSEHGSVSVLTDDLRLIALPNAPGVWRGEDEGWMLRRPEELDSPWIDDASRAFGEQPEAQRGEPVRFSSAGEVWWGQVRRQPLSAERGLVTVVAVPNSDLLVHRNVIRLWIVILTLVALGGAVAWAAVQAKRVSEPIEALALQSERIRQGDLEPPRREITSKLEEVRKLAVAQNHMREGLAALMKLERDLQLARQIQESTFPERLPLLKGFELEAWSQPADETGGDTYDVIGYLASNGTRPLIDEGRVDGAVFLLADATGHGIGPALSVTQIRAMLRMAMRMQGDLTKVASHLNAQLYADLPRNRFITAWLGELDASRHTLTSFSAGQGPLLRYDARRDTVEFMNANVPPFGLMPVLPVVEPSTVELLPGDIYAVLSDGFFEAGDGNGAEFGKERVAEVFGRHHQAGADAILRALREAISVFTNDSPAADDRTALIIKRVS